MNARFDALQRKRKLKQLVMAPLFLAILTAGWFYPLLGFFIPVCMVLGVTIAVFRGRRWCDWLCPRGSFYDALIKPVSPGKEIPRVFRGMPLRLTVLTMLMIVMAVNLILRWPHLDKIGLFFVTLLTVTTGAGIILALFLHPRTWCTICPIGTVISLISRNKKPLKINSELCIECKVCHNVCPMQISAYAWKKQGVETVREGDCLQCNLCVAACPKQALKG